MPARDALDARQAGELVPQSVVLEAERVQATLPDGQVTSGTYRRKPRA
jgi:hypothetical protein